MNKLLISERLLSGLAFHNQVAAWWNHVTFREVPFGHECNALPSLWLYQHGYDWDFSCVTLQMKILDYLGCIQDRLINSILHYYLYQEFLPF